MNLALQQAKINLGNTRENPSVGCIITKNNTVISCGFTSLNGRPHAEHNAIHNSRESLKNCNLYTTLEPCSHYGKTNPCTGLIVKNKIKRVFFSIKDDDLRSYKKASTIFKNKKVFSYEGILSNVIKNFYRSYIIQKKNNIPFVTAKLAISKDNYTAHKNKKWITNKYSRGRVHLLRSCHDCIISSSETVTKDNSRLNCRIYGLEKTTPGRIILDRKLKISTSSQLIKDAKKYRTIIFYNETKPHKLKIMRKHRVSTYKIPLNGEGYLDLKKALEKAKKLKFYRIFLESGIKLTSSFLKENLVNDLKLFISNKKLGTKGHRATNGYLNNFFKKKSYTNEKVNLLGDRLITYKLK